MPWQYRRRWRQSGQVTLAGGKPLRLRGRFARDGRAAPPVTRMNLSVEGAGPNGLLSVTAGPDDTVPKVFVTAAALATAFIPDQTARTRTRPAMPPVHHCTCCWSPRRRCRRSSPTAGRR